MKTIWSKDSLPLVPARFRPWFRVMLPAVDVLVLWFAVAAVLVGSQVVDTFTVGWFETAWGAVLGLSALTALAGLVFLRERVELCGKCVMVIGLGAYAATLGINVAAGKPSSLLAQAITVALIVVLLSRIGDLIGEIGREEADREH